MFLTFLLNFFDLLLISLASLLHAENVPHNIRPRRSRCEQPPGTEVSTPGTPRLGPRGASERASRDVLVRRMWCVVGVLWAFLTV